MEINTNIIRSNIIKITQVASENLPNGNVIVNELINSLFEDQIDKLIYLLKFIEQSIKSYEETGFYSNGVESDFNLFLMKMKEYNI